MNILQVSPYVVEPPNAGGAHRAHGIVKEFPRLGANVVRYCQGASPEMYKNMNFSKKVKIDERYTEIRHTNPIHDVAMFPVQFGFPNVFAGTALKLAPGPIDRLLDEADLTIVRAPWQFSTIFSRSNSPVVYSSHNVEIERFESINPSFYNLFQNRVRKLEKIAVEKSAATICTSERDADQYRNKFDVDSPLILAPNGTSRASVRSRRPKSESAMALREDYGYSPSTTVAMFVGSDYEPNVQAAEHIIEMAEMLQSQSTSIQFLIVGTVGNSLRASPSNVTVTGFVEEFETHFDIADIALNPMTTGGGTNIKLFDYFARGVPVISTPFGTRGIELIDGEHVFISSIDSFIDTIENISNDPARRRQVGRSSRQLVENKFTWEDISEDLFHRLTKTIE